MKSAVVFSALLTVFSGAALAQTPAARGASLDDLVSEVRGLRADVQKMAQATVRAQLMVARLQVQEQRIAGLSRELSETESQIRGLEAARNPFAGHILKELAQTPPKAGEPDMFAALREQLEKIENGDPVLKERQVSLSRLLSEEQARWAAFNAQLEALERDLPVVIRK